MTSPRPSAFQRCCVAAVAAAMLLQPMAAYAAPIATNILSEIPLQGLNPVKPNIMFTVDDSGSMSQEYLPDFAAEGPTNPGSPQIYYCRDGRHCGGIADSRVGPWVISTSDPPIRSSNHNGQFYDPAATYLAGRRSDGTTLPNEASNPGTWTNVYVNGFAGYPGANDPTPGVGTINLVTSYPDTAWCNAQASNPPSAADLATAFADGSKCRLNGRPYAAFTEPTNLWSAPAVSAGYNYPNLRNVATGSSTTCGGANQYCIFNVRGDVFANPYYYTIDRIQYCDAPTAGGFGTGNCQDRWSQDVFRYIRYYSATPQPFDPLAFKRIDIKATGVEVNGVVAANPSGHTYAEEMANFARWYTFYRNRLLGMKTAGGIAFSALSEESARAGLHTLNENATKFLNVGPFDSTQKTEWFNRFYSLVPGGGTPLPDAVFRVGEYFKASGLSTLPGATDPLHPTFGMCQQNFHLLATDGYWNVNLNGAGAVGNTDRTVPASLPGPIPGFVPGSPFPRPYLEGPAASNTLSDLTMKYWINDLRPTLDNRVNDTIAPWQHVTLYGLAIGLQGTTVYPTGLNAITAGTANWPSPYRPDGTSGGPEAGDDLWHAALNSRGKFFNANSPQQLAESIVAAIADFTDQSGTGTSVGVAGAQFTATRNFGYRASYESGWWGDVKKYALNPDTGALPVDPAGNPRDPPVWSAATQLDAQVLGNGWDTNRKILTINDASGQAVPFRLGSLSLAQQNSLTAGWAASPAPVAPTAQAVLNYLRGDKSQEGSDSAVPNFRIRSHALGDIAYSGAVAVGPPSQPYIDASNPGYQSFVTSHATRTPMVYVGANDGMMHALDDSPGLNPNAGKEVWAFIPKALYSNQNPNETAHAPDPTDYQFQLAALSYRRGGIPLFDHKFMVNATARAWDVDFANTNTSTPPQTGNNWHSILVGGLGAGGRSVYALDITTPVASTENETTIANSGRVLWEFTDPNLGYIYDPPTIVKTFAYGWVVLVPSGYNNPGGKGFLYVLNPETGQLLQKLPLPNDPGTDINPTGLSTIRAYTASRRDPLVLQAYGGDLHGDVWRFDLSNANPSNWRVDLIAKLKDAAGNEQPITTGVRVEIDQTNNVDRYLFVGTGKLLGSADIMSATVRNTLYVIRDGTRTTPEPAPATPYSRSNLNAVDGSSVTGFAGAPTGRGWYQDAADLTEKIGTDAFADVQTVVFAFSKPTSDPCAAPLSSRLFARDFNSGASVLIAPNGGVVPGYDISSGIAGVQLIQGAAGANGTASGEIRALVTTMKGEVFSFAISPPASPAARHRVSWRLLNKN